MTFATEHKLEPAYSVIELLGGKTEICDLLKVDKSTLTRWCCPRPAGTGGMIPLRHWPFLIIHGKKKGIEITLENLAGVKKIKKSA